MIETLIAILASKIFAYGAGSIAAIILAWILKRIPNDKIKAIFGGFCYKLGVIITLGLSKWKYTAKFWNKTIEPYFIDLIDNVIGEGIKQFILGLRSDNSGAD